MSLNLHLLAQRKVQNSSDIKENDQIEIDILETPSKISNKLIKLEYFDDILSGYCEWVNTQNHNLTEEYFPVFSNSDMSYHKDDYEVRETITKNQPRFDEIHKHSKYKHYETNENIIIAYLHLKEISHEDRLRKRVRELYDQGYYLYWEAY